MSRKRKSGPEGQIDLTAAIEAPVKVKRDGEVASVHPHEATLRQHVRKALVDGSVSSMKFLITEAEKHKVIRPPPAPPKGGVLVIPKNLPEDLDRAIWAELNDYKNSGALSRAIHLLRKFYDGLRGKSDGNR